MATSVGVGEARTTSGIAEEEFDLLVELHQRSIYRLLLSLTRDPDAAETLTQDCFLKAFQNRMSFRGDSTAKTWLTRIAINLAYDYRRNRRAQFWKRLFQRADSHAITEAREGTAYGAEAWLETLADNHSTAERQLLAREQLAGVWQAVERLPNQQRTVFLLRFVEEMSLEEISQAIGVRVASVKTHLRRATLAVRQAVGTPLWGVA